MSFALPDVDLTAAAVGQKGTILLQNMGISAGGVSANPAFLANPPTLYFHNDSGCGLGMTLKNTGQSFNLPAGAWVPIPIGPGESEVDYVVKYVLPNPPVSTLMITYYGPGEPIPQTSTLGNSPVGIGGSVQTSSVQTLSNEGNAAGGLVVDIGDVTISQLWKIFTDHFSIAVDQAGVTHTVLKGNTTGNPLQLGQVGDITEVLGKLTADQLLTAALGIAISASGLSVIGGTTSDSLTVTGNSALTGVITSNNGMSIVEGGLTSTIFNDAGGFLNLNNPTSIQQVINGIGQFHVDANGAGLGAGSMHFLTGSIARVTIVSFTTVNGTTGTIAHGLGATPDIIIGNAFNTGVNSANITIGFSEVNATTFKASSIAVAACKALCIKS